MDENKKNGFGFCYATEPTGAESAEVFPVDAQNVLELVESNGSVLISAQPGAGKSHLVQDVMIEAVKERPVLKLTAEISGGSRSGADNALYVLDTFADRHPEGLLIVDNVDYYGYSGSRISRRRAVADAHVKVAAMLTDMVLDTTTPDVCGTAHTQDWRDSHWLYGEKYLDEAITPTAQAFVDSFGANYEFTGEIDETVARRVLLEKSNGLLEHLSIPSVISAVENHAGCLLFRYFSNLRPGFGNYDIPQALTAIDDGTANKLGRALD